VITETHVRRLCDDALIVASAVRLYVPVKQKRAHTAAARIYRRLGFGSIVRQDQLRRLGVKR
jgi:hypothetical protein